MTSTAARESQLNFGAERQPGHRNSHRIRGFVIAATASAGLWALIGGVAWLVVSFTH